MDTLLLSILSIGVGILAIDLCITIGTKITSWWKTYKLESNTDDDYIEVQSTSLNLSFAEVHEILDTVIEEVVVNKYNLYYSLKDLMMIPKSDDEIIAITKDILKAFSDDYLENVYRYYTRDYFISIITRRAQIFIIDYTKKNKPTSK